MGEAFFHRGRIGFPFGEQLNLGLGRAAEKLRGRHGKQLFLGLDQRRQRGFGPMLFARTQGRAHETSQFLDEPEQIILALG